MRNGFRDVSGPYVVEHPVDVLGKGSLVSGVDSQLTDIGSAICICPEPQHAEIICRMLNDHGKEYGLSFVESAGAWEAVKALHR